MSNEKIGNIIAAACDRQTKFRRRSNIALAAGKRTNTDADRLYVLPGGTDMRNLNLCDLEAINPATLSHEHVASRNMRLGLLRLGQPAT